MNEPVSAAVKRRPLRRLVRHPQNVSRIKLLDDSTGWCSRGSRTVSSVDDGKSGGELVRLDCWRHFRRRRPPSGSIVMPAIVHEMSAVRIQPKKPMFSKAAVFDGLTDGIIHHKKYFSLCISICCRSH